jgi:gluconolactonase
MCRTFAGLLSLLALAGGAVAQPHQPAPASTPAPARPFEVIRLDPGFDRLIAPDTKLETIAVIRGFSGEGPLWRNGRLLVSDQKNGPIYEVSLDGTFRVLLDKASGRIDPTSRVNQGPTSLAIWKSGEILIARQAARDIGVLSRDGTARSMVPSLDGKRFNSPNDITVGRDGSIWFTDPPFGLPGFDRTPGAPPPPDKDIPFNGVFRWKDGKVEAVITDMTMPNGIGLSPDGKTLYVANSIPQMYIRAYDVRRDGALSNQRDFARFAANSPMGRGVPDGLKVDARGNVWTTGPGGIIVLAPDGRMLGRIQTPAMTSNIAFGEDGRSLFLTSGANIYRIRTLTRGQSPPFAPR